MPIAIPRMECARKPSSEKTSGIHCEAEKSMHTVKTGTFPSTHLDTLGNLDCNIISGHIPMQKEFFGCPSFQQPDKSYGPSDKVRAIVNIQITSDAIIRTHVSLYDTVGTISSQPRYTGQSVSNSFFSKQCKSAILDTPPDYEIPISHDLVSFDSSNQGTCARFDDKREVVSIRRTLYSVDPAIYSDVCEPLAHWIADHVWKVTTQGLSLPLAFVGSS
jgi:hypothetical protein